MHQLLLPKQRILENNNNYTLGIWLSGGADSSLLCYLLAKHIKENSLPYKIQTVTIPKRKTDTHHLKVLNFIIESLDCKDIFCEPDIHYVDSKNYLESFLPVNINNIASGKYNYIYSGINQTPDKENYDVHWQGIAEVEKIRSKHVDKLLFINLIIEHEGSLYEFGDIRPFFNLDKKQIAKLYKEEGLVDTLFPLTNSCNDLETVDSHCGECWFCKERLWAFGKI